MGPTVGQISCNITNPNNALMIRGNPSNLPYVYHMEISWNGG